MKRSWLVARITAISGTWLAAGWLVASCASGEDAGLFPAEPTGAGGGFDSGADGDAAIGGASGASGSTGFGGSGGVGVGGTTGFGGTGGAPVGGVGGTSVGGTGGTSAGGAGGTGAAGTGGAGAGGTTGTCNPAFCPSSFGTPCCITPNGPCGCDMGMGCMSCTTGGF